MFSMFFGAGNVVFPLEVGKYAESQNFFAITGLLITAVGVPLLGLVSMTLFNGNYLHFLERIGKLPGYLLTLLIVALIGPFGAMPRVVTLAHGTIHSFVPHLNLFLFSLLSCSIIFLFTYRKSRILELLGAVLTPILLISLSVIIIKGIIGAPTPLESSLSSTSAFFHGFKEGYQTMDLFAAFFFSAVVLKILEQQVDPTDKSNYKQMIMMTLKAGCISVSLLSLVYAGFSYVAAAHGNILADVPTEKLLSKISTHMLGPYASLIACIAVTFACLTTAIALAVVFAEFLHENIFKEKVSYIQCLIITLGFTLLMTPLNFSGIIKFVGPILEICYPGLIVLSILNIAYKLFHFKPVKVPVYAVFFISFIHYISS
jgi:LIVCS family branched-chain amino acid:cation transporter